MTRSDAFPIHDMQENLGYARTAKSTIPNAHLESILGYRKTASDMCPDTCGGVGDTSFGDLSAAVAGLPLMYRKSTMRTNLW